MSPETRSRILNRLAFVYGNDVAASLWLRIDELVNKFRPRIRSLQAGWSQRDALLITYGDTITGSAAPLEELHSFLSRRVGDRLTFVHLLPFYPYTSDDGFSVVDFRAVRDDLGSWKEIEGLSQGYRLVFDGVINHVSASSQYVQGFLGGDPAYRDFCIALPPETDTSAVLRTRNLPLLHEYPAHDRSSRWLWTTFSRDQIDLNFSNPEVLIEILDVLLEYAAKGAAMIRLDAIPYLWKKLGTSCAHLPETHALIKLIRAVLDAAAPHVLLLTETNVPHQENLSYFGEAGDEAQLIYNFSLAPLVAWSFLKEDASALTQWARSIEWISPRATYLNITATHDGIGMRPTEGILSEAERRELVQMALDRGGDMTGKRNPDGTVAPYELNLSYFDAINDPRLPAPREQEVARFLASQAIPMAMLGIPGIYIHSLLGSRNAHEAVKRTGRARSINRAQLDRSELEAELNTPESLRHAVFSGLLRLLKARSAEPAFHPDARQEVLALHPGVFALRRLDAVGNSLLALHSVSRSPLTIPLPASEGGCNLQDLITGKRIGPGNSIRLAPAEVLWLKRRDK